MPPYCVISPTIPFKKSQSNPGSACLIITILSFDKSVLISLLFFIFIHSAVIFLSPMKFKISFPMKKDSKSDFFAKRGGNSKLEDNFLSLIFPTYLKLFNKFLNNYPSMKIYLLRR